VITMTKRLATLGLTAFCAAAAAACNQDFPTLSSATAKETFAAQLTAAAARPAGTGSGVATATFVLQDTVSMTYEVVGSGLPLVTRLQLQAGTAADSGRVMATLFTSAAGVNVDSNRVVRAGTISRTGTTFVAPFTYDSLVRRIREGTAFVLVRTIANPLGAARGQITPLAR
jgi:hypothetical protein